MLNLDDRLIKEIAPVIKPNSLAVLLAICIHLDKQNRAFPSIKRIRELTGLGRDAVYSAIDILVKENLVLRERKNGSAGKFGSTIYVVNTDLIRVYVPVKDLHITGKPDMVAPSSESPDPIVPYPEHPYPENPARSINNSISINHNEVLKDREHLPESSIEIHPTVQISENEGNHATDVKTSNFRLNRKEIKQDCLFRETEFVTLADGRDRFKAALIARNPAYDSADLDYYYEAVRNWSDSKHARKKDWIATAANFILGDKRDGKLVLTKTNLHETDKTTINGVDLDRAMERTARILANRGE